MGCGAKCLKVILIIVNIIFFLAGAAVLGAGLWVRFDKSLEKFKGADTGLQEFRDGLYLAAYVLVAFGAFTFVVGFCGCCGAMRESKCLLGTYIALVVVILGAEIGGGVYGYVNRDTLLNKFDTAATDYLKKNYGKNTVGDEAWNNVMQVFKCCGVHGVSDFENSEWKKLNTTYVVPDSCCVLNDKQTAAKDYRQCMNDAKDPMKKTTNTANLYGVGCLPKVKELIKDNSVLLLGIGAGVAGFELLVVIMAIGFCCSMKDDD